MNDVLQELHTNSHSLSQSRSALPWSQKRGARVSTLPAIAQ